MYKKYGFFGTIKLICSVLYTKLLFPKARIIRLPFDIRNRHFISIGKGFTTGTGCRLEAYPNESKVALFLGDDIEINDYVHITAIDEVRIGNHVLIASKVYISDSSHGSYTGDNSDSSPMTIPKHRPHHTKKVNIGDYVWLGESVCVLPGVNIGRGTIVGAGAVVTKNLPEYVIAVGNPAKAIKKFNFETERWEKYL